MIVTCFNKYSKVKVHNSMTIVESLPEYLDFHHTKDNNSNYLFSFLRSYTTNPVLGCINEISYSVDIV